MSHCHDEHSHSHSHGDDDHHNHDHTDDITPALQSYIYQQIEFDKIVTLNETDPGSGSAVVKKGWDKRLDPQPEVVSDADEQLLMYIPFTGQLKLHSLLLRSSMGSSAPSTLHMFLNRDDLDFSSATDLPPTQTLQLSQTNEIQEIPLKRALWNTTQSVTLFFVDNYAIASGGDRTGTGVGRAGGEEEGDNEEVTRFSFLGFKGQWMPLNREPVNVLYEAAANPGDHPSIVGTRDPLSGNMNGARDAGG